MSREGYSSHPFMHISKDLPAVTLIFLWVLLLLTACSDDPEGETGPESETGNIKFTFTHNVDDQAIQLDRMMYVNSAGNPYEINEVMYFISDVMLYRDGGKGLLIDEWKDIHYVELAIPSTLTWEVFDNIPVGSYDSITFVFGIPEEKNESFMFVNPPEDKMM